MDRAKRLGEGSIPRLLLKFSAPAIVGMMAQALYNVVDRIFVGQGVGERRHRRRNGRLPLHADHAWPSACWSGIGAAALVSIRLGEKKKDEAEQVLGNAAVLLVVRRPWC